MSLTLASGAMCLICKRRRSHLRQLPAQQALATMLASPLSGTAMPCSPKPSPSAPQPFRPVPPTERRPATLVQTTDVSHRAAPISARLEASSREMAATSATSSRCAAVWLLKWLSASPCAARPEYRCTLCNLWPVYVHNSMPCLTDLVILCVRPTTAQGAAPDPSPRSSFHLWSLLGLGPLCSGPSVSWMHTQGAALAPTSPALLLSVQCEMFIQDLGYACMDS
jgi:hypothetical protein